MFSQKIIKSYRRGFLFASFLLAFSPAITADDRKLGLEVDIFVSVDCPIANSYAPHINRLHETFGPKGVRFRLVYPDASLKPDDVNRHRKEYSLEPEAVIDTDHSLVEQAGASVTPEVVVFDKEGTLRYRGKIDNRFTDYGDKRRVATEKYLEDALRRLIAGEDIEFREEKAVGCLIDECVVDDIQLVLIVSATVAAFCAVAYGIHILCCRGLV